MNGYGRKNFPRQCVERVNTFSGVITQQSRRLGQWMDWENSYFTHTDENIQGIWHFLKKCHAEGLLRQEHKPMPWCPRCGTSLSEHEMTGSYQQMTHASVFFQLPLDNAQCAMRNAQLNNANILVWTTTPWTLSSNVALAVNPEIDYALVKVKSQDRPLVLAKQAIRHLGEDKLEVLEVFKGAALVGLRTETCFPEFPAQAGVEHRVVAWEDVDAAEGTGVVHIAPGCGAEDFALGLRENLPQVMPVDDLGIFLEGFGFLSGKRTDSIAGEVFEALKKAGKLYKIEDHEHSYPVCWRCKTPVIFRLVPAWYIATGPLKPRLLAAAEKVKWEPESGGRRMADWLNNMGDWNISRKRYYGLPLPFYPCDSCGELTVVGSREELRALGGADVDKLPELHRPWIDQIKIKCPKCGKELSRIPDTGDVWLDAGIVPYSTLGYFSDRAAWERNFPAEWVVEMSEQVRLWFYSMLFMSVVLEDRPPYEHVMCHSSVVKEDGGRFSKTGFMIQFDEAAERIGSDAIRYLYAGNPLTSDVRFGFTLGDEARRKLLGFRNIYTFFDTYASIDRPALAGFSPDPAQLTIMDRWLLLRGNEFLRSATKRMEQYRAYQLVKEFEEFVEDVSNWYIRLNRRRFWKSEDKNDQMAAYYSLYSALKIALRVMAPILPFMTEDIWQKLVRRVEPEEALSVHLSAWPEAGAPADEDELLASTRFVREFITNVLRLRNEKQVKVRQPLQTLYVSCGVIYSGDIQMFRQQILDELNIKELVFLDNIGTLREQRPEVNFKMAGAVLKQRLNAFKEHLAALSPAEAAHVVEQLASGGTVAVPRWEGEALSPALFQITSHSKPGITMTTFWEDQVDVALDINITDALRREGAVRDLIRQIQTMRKEAGYTVEQRIRLSVLGGGFAPAADHIMAEVLAEAFSEEHLAKPDMVREIEINGEKLRIEISK
ncbi:MAG: class I tRNA ligase family protein, partial [Oscillospiraceae bacterium]|nr:class I tRNA ligase family protein [Oscillospiraceae bacterium]